MCAVVDEAVEERLSSFLTQLQSEYAILDRLVYKNKNQHRRGSYFQYLMKVRRDLRLLQSAKLEEVLVQCFYVINGKKPSLKVIALESLNKSKRGRGRRDFMMRLLGSARLLSQMVEPMLKTASKISTLLAQSFFINFSVTVLAVIARLRILAQQILIDVVSVFNAVSSISHKQQSIKIVQEGIEVFREYYPKQEEIITLECSWETDKYVLIERTERIEPKAEDMSLISSAVKYTSIEAFLEDDETNGNKADIDDNQVNSLDTNSSSGHGERMTKSSCEIKSNDRPIPTIPGRSVDSSLLKRKLECKNRVAFVSVKRPAPSSVDQKDTLLQKAGSSIEDQIYNLFNSDVPGSSLI